MTPLPYLAAARVAGEDAAAFLHAQLSADILGLQPSEATFACYCSPRGQVLGLLLVGRLAEELVLLGSASLLPALLARLGLFVLRSRVRLEATPEQSCVGLPGATAPGFDGVALEPRGVDLRYGVTVSQAAPVGSGASWKAEELRRGIAWLEAATSERFIPQMLGFEGIGAVSFSKGCYPGQEIVARARYLGQVKRKPMRLSLEGGADLPAGAPGRLLASESAVDVSVVDSAPGGHGTVALVVAPELAGTVEALEVDGRRYRCATM